LQLWQTKASTGAEQTDQLLCGRRQPVDAISTPAPEAEHDIVYEAFSVWRKVVAWRQFATVKTVDKARVSAP
jgi:ABC-type tungstate transport system permease subunit